MGISICGLPAVLLGVVYLLCSSCNGQLSTDVDELLNWCIDGIHHKERPSTEDELHHMVI